MGFGGGAFVVMAEEGAEGAEAGGGGGQFGFPNLRRVMRALGRSCEDNRSAGLKSLGARDTRNK
jgi:hypothetical protein